MSFKIDLSSQHGMQLARADEARPRESDRTTSLYSTRQCAFARPNFAANPYQKRESQRSDARQNISASLSNSQSEIATHTVLSPVKTYQPKPESQLQSSHKTVVAQEPHQKFRQLLSDPALASSKKTVEQILSKNMQGESLRFLEDLNQFKARPTPDAARQIKARYLDHSADDFDFSKVSADDFGKQVEAAGINIADKTRKKCELEFNSAMKYLEKGDSPAKAGLAFVFDDAERHIAHLLSQSLRGELDKINWSG